MNKTEKIIALLLGAVLAWMLFSQAKAPQKQNAAPRQAQSVERSATPQQPLSAPAERKDTTIDALAAPTIPEKTFVLENEELRLVVSSHGAVVKSATLKRYSKDLGEVSDSNPALTVDFAAAPLGAVGGAANLAANAPYECSLQQSNAITLVSGPMTRRITLGKDYLVTFDDDFTGDTKSATTLSLGAMHMGDSKNDLLSIDGFVRNDKGGSVIHYCDSDALKGYLVGGLAGGCSGCGSSGSVALPPSSTIPVAGSHAWMAIKNRFFVTALVSTTGTMSDRAEVTVVRDAKSPAAYRPGSVSAKLCFADCPAKRTSVFYVGPKKQSLLAELGMRDVMEFGMWRWICYPIVWLLNLFYSLIPNYGVAIILLTVLVRLIFWPLTRKSTVGMKKMQEVQPLMKEIQAKYKDNPQRMQQEIWQLYREHKVNPMSSCLPMLIQIPVFIALFNVLRSAVELRYAPFLWIADLSEPEGLFASWFPFGGLNILPILMAATMAIQSALTPSAGDRSQQRMMIVFMPVMMLVMFYSFPSALSLYWTLSQLFSIVQMWLIRRQGAKKTAVVPEVIDPPVTRQMRRHG